MNPRSARLSSELVHWSRTSGAVLVLSTVLFLSYQHKVAPIFAYSGLTFRHPDPIYYSVAIVLTTVVAICLPRQIRRASDFLLWMLFVFAAAPSILLPQYMDLMSYVEATELGLAVAGCMVISRIGALGVPNVDKLRPGQRLTRFIWPGIAAVTCVNYAYIVAEVGVPTGWVGLADVYDLRGEVTAAAGTALLGYLTPLQANVLNPLLVARGLFCRRPVELLAGLSGQVFIYLSFGHKSVLFSTIALLAIAALFRHSPQPRGSQLLMGAALIATCSLLLDQLLNSFVYTSLFVRRFLIIPGALTAAYVSVFQHRPKTYFADSLAFWAESPYREVPPSYIVGREFTRSPGTNANVNIFGSGFVSAGYLGMVIIAILFVLLLWAADAATAGLPLSVVAITFFMPAIVLSSASLFTAMSTHGLVAAVLLCAFLPRDGWLPRRPPAPRRGEASRSSHVA